MGTAPSSSGAPSEGGASPVAQNVWRSPPEILSLFIEFVPTFFVPSNCIAAVLNEEARALVRGRGRFNMFLKKYRFFFDVRLVDGARLDIRLRDDVNHPKRGIADQKYSMTDVGDVKTYTAKPEYIQSLDPLESTGQQSVNIRPVVPPPSVHVRLEERVPVLEKLREMVPKEFVPVEELEEKIPEDILFHPYFDCQGGLIALASKFPEHFQVVEGRIRLRPPHLAPMATDEYSFSNSPLPALAARLQKLVCLTDVPQWVSVTSLYEQLRMDERRQIKKDFKSFAGFLRAHGRSLAISTDTLSVALWIPPQTRDGADQAAKGSAGGSSAPTEAGQYTLTQILNELFDRFPRGKTLSIRDALSLLPTEMTAHHPPRKFALFFQSHPGYFVVDYPEDPDRCTIRRSSDRVPLDIAVAMYPFIPESGIAVPQLMTVLPASLQAHITQVGMSNVADSLAEWLELLDGDVFRRKTEEELERAVLEESGALKGMGEDDIVGEDLTFELEAEANSSFVGDELPPRGGDAPPQRPPPITPQPNMQHQRGPPPPGYGRGGPPLPGYGGRGGAPPPGFGRGGGGGYPPGISRAPPRGRGY